MEPNPRMMLWQIEHGYQQHSCDEWVEIKRTEKP